MPLGTKREPRKARKDLRLTEAREGRLGSPAEVAKAGQSLEARARVSDAAPPKMPSPGRLLEQAGGGRAAIRPAQSASAPAAPRATPQAVPTPATRQTPSLGLIRGPEPQRRGGGEREQSGGAEEAHSGRRSSREEADPYEGMSEATVIVEMMLDEAERIGEALVAAFGIPFGLKETTEAKWREWFKNDATPEQRRQEMATLGLPEVLRRVYGEQVPQGVG